MTIKNKDCNIKIKKLTLKWIKYNQSYFSKKNLDYSRVRSFKEYANKKNVFEKRSTNDHMLEITLK